MEPVETARVPGAGAPGLKPRPPFAGKRSLYNVVPVRFERSFVTELYNAGELLLTAGEHVVADTIKGPALAEVCGVVERRVLERGRVPRIIRRATATDVERHQANREKAREAFKFCLGRIHARDLEMKLCQVEYMLDGSRILFYFSAEHRVDFRQLVRDLARRLDGRIEMRQVGVRDGAGLVGGIGPCGKELCCSSFLTNFRSISIRHAKDQGLTLNPKKVSGMCGRLMCCLVYEHPLYRKARAGSPRVNRAAQTIAGRGIVTEVHLLQRKVKVLLEGGASETFPFSEVVVDNSTILRARDIAQAPPSRPRRSASLTRAGSNLREEYVWDGAESDDLLDSSGSATSPDPSEKPTPKRRRRRRRRRRTASTADSKPSEANAAGADRTSSKDSSSASTGTTGPAKKTRRRRRRRGRRRRGGTSNTDGGGSKPES